MNIIKDEGGERIVIEGRVGDLGWLFDELKNRYNLGRECYLEDADLTICCDCGRPLMDCDDDCPGIADEPMSPEGDPKGD